MVVSAGFGVSFGLGASAAGLSPNPFGSVPFGLVVSAGFVSAGLVSAGFGVSFGLGASAAGLSPNPFGSVPFGLVVSAGFVV